MFEIICDTLKDSLNDSSCEIDIFFPERKIISYECKKSRYEGKV